MESKILFVDDNKNLLESVQRQLRGKFKIETATSGAIALETLQSSEDFVAIVADMRMPEMDGVELLSRVKKGFPNIVRIMLTGNADQNTAINAINHGQIFRFLNKPADPDQLVAVLNLAQEQGRLIRAERELLNNTLSGVTAVLGDVIGLLDTGTFELSQLIRQHIGSVLKQYNIVDGWDIEVAASLSQLGYLTLPQELRQKNEAKQPLSEEEQKLILEHPQIGSDFVSRLPRLSSVAEIILNQNKSFDGSGFPYNDLKGEQIPLGSRLIKILFHLAQSTADGKSQLEALNDMKTQKTVFDPEGVEAVRAAIVYSAPHVGEPIPDTVPITNIEVPEAKPIPSSEPVFSEPLKAKVKDLEVGHISLSEIKGKSGVLIQAPGREISAVTLARIKSHHAMIGVIEPIVVVKKLKS
ncbi:MAG: response regulator [Bdellovibrionales bacterium]|nr:response regulator [Bdellovibrionales bacterium]